MGLDRVDILLSEGLDSIEVAAPINEGLEAVRRNRRRKQKRHRAIAGLAAAVVGVGMIAVTASILDEDPQRLSTDPGSTTSTVPSTSEVTGPVGAVVLDPPGPHRDGDEVDVVLVGMAPADVNHEPPRLCATVDGVETCDPLWTGAFYKAAISKWTFTASGWQDCSAASVDCRIVVNGADGEAHRSERLVIEGQAPPPAARLTVSAPAGTAGIVDVARLEPTNLTAHASWREWEAELEANGNDLTAFTASVCTFQAPPGGYQCDLLSYFRSIDPDQPDDPVEMPVAREILGFDGWHDCAATPCFVLVSATQVSAVTANGTYASDAPVAAAPIVFDPTKSARPRPALSISGGPQVALGEEIEIHIENLPTLHNETLEVAICHQDPSVSNDCGYLTHTADRPVPIDETIHLTLTMNWPVEVCERDGCFLALMIGQEGAPPLATLPLEVRT